MDAEEEDFISSLLQIRESLRSPKELTSALQAAILRVGSESPDNKACVQHLEVGAVPQPLGSGEILTVKLRGHQWSVSNVINVAEDAPIPNVVAEEFPGLSVPEWQACLRLATLVMSLFERWTASPPDSSMSSH